MNYLNVKYILKIPPSWQYIFSNDFGQVCMSRCRIFFHVVSNEVRSGIYSFSINPRSHCLHSGRLESSQELNFRMGCFLPLFKVGITYYYCNCTKNAVNRTLSIRCRKTWAKSLVFSYYICVKKLRFPPNHFFASIFQ